MSMRKMPGLRAIQHSQAGPESNKACYVLTSQAIETRRAKYGEESDSDHRHAEASGGGNRRRSGTFEETGGEHFDRHGHDDHQAPEERRAHPHRRPRHPPGAQARRPDGPQSRDRRSHSDQGEQEGRLPRRQGTQGSRLRRLPTFNQRHSGLPRGPGMALFLLYPLCPLSLPRFQNVPSLQFKNSVTERFLRYVVIDTQSDPASPSCPSTEKQKDLGRLLAAELQAMGLADAHLDAHGYVYATIPANTQKKVPVICFCSHMDTSPDCTGKGVKPQIVKNYRGGDIVLPADPTQVIRAAEHGALSDQIGHDIITTDGTTLLGADNKAGIAEIMDAAQFLIDNPQIQHGAIKILFTPDEEIGRGVDKLDLKKLGADFAYTMDGETVGNIEDETFSADGATITIEGVSTHPGFAKGKMEHAIKIAAAIVDRLPKHTCSPETTEGKEGFLHPTGISGALQKAKIDFIVRDFNDEGLKQKEALLEAVVKDVMKDYPRSTYRMEVKHQYRNMKQVIDAHPEIVDYAIEAIRRAGLTPVKASIRGGTDGSRLSFMGLPCPNIFAGEHAFHSRLEWVSVQDMEKAVQTIVHLAMIWEEKA